MARVKQSETGTMTATNWANILILGGGFLLLFTAFQTTAFVQGITIDSFFSASCVNNGTNHSDQDYIVDGGIRISEKFSKRIGYISLCIIYLMVALGNWVSVPIVTVFGAKWACVISGALYVVYIIALIRPYVPVIFLGAFILGSAGGVLWTAQGQILIQNSSKAKMGMTSGIFWFMLQNSLIIGNLFFFIYLHFRVKDAKCIPRLDNYIIFSIFSLLGIGGVILMVFITPLSKKGFSSSGGSSNINVDSDSGSADSATLLGRGTVDHQAPHENLYQTLEEAWLSLGRAVKMMVSTDMLLLIVCFIYTGYELNFWSGVYGTMIGHTHRFTGATVGLAGLFIGLGEILGGGLFGIFGKYTNRFGKDPVVLLGMLVHLVTYFLIYLNLPAHAIGDTISTEDSFGVVFDPSNVYIAMLCAFLLGFGDACFNTQIYSIIGNLYPLDQDSAPAMALYKCFQSLATMVGFVTSTFILLRWQLLILVILASLGTLSFAAVEWRHYKPSQNKFK